MILASFLLNARYAFNPRKPLLLARLAFALARNVFLPARLRYVEFCIGFACNLKCGHCFATALSDPSRPVMKLEEYRRVAGECMRLGALNFSFQGGEPLLFKELKEIIAACRPSRTVISVTTNGTLVTKERARELKKMGVDILTVSLDSGIAQEHDAFRGSAGAHASALQGIENALAAGLKVTLGTVVTHGTLHSPGLDAAIRFAKEKKLLLYFILPVPAGKWKDRRDMLLTEDDLSFLIALTEQSPLLRTDFQANMGGFGCGAAKEILYLTPYGDVLACPFLHISFGNIFQDTIAAIRQCALVQPSLSAYHPRCLASTDRAFMEHTLQRVFAADHLPLPHEQAFPNEVSEKVEP